MSVKMIGLAWECQDVAEGSELLVLLALCDRANDDGFCHPSMLDIAARARMSDRMARTYIRRLEAKGVLEIEPNKGGKGKSNRYRITLQTRKQASEYEGPKPGNALPVLSPKPGSTLPRMSEKSDPKLGSGVSQTRKPTSEEPYRTVSKKDITPLYPPKPKRSRSPQTDTPEFVRFWDAYPRRVGKGQARRAWATAIKKTDPETIIAAAHQVEDRQQYTPHPATWLNGERWADERMTVTRMEPNHDRPRRADHAAARASRDFGAVGWPEPRTSHADPDRGHGPGAGSYLALRPRD